MPNNIQSIRVSRSWGSHGYSVYGVYWKRWRDQSSEEMSEEDFIKESEKIAADILEDQQQMRSGDQRPIFSLTRENT